MHIFNRNNSPPPVEGVFISRPNRFLIIAETGGRKVRVHCPNPGRMWEILHSGRKLVLVPAITESRKTPYSLAAAFYDGKIIPMNASLSNRIAEELILPVLFPKSENLRREYTLPDAAGYRNKIKNSGARTVKGKTKSRFDFHLESEGKKHLIEVKSCTLSEEGVAMFPDAPTERGRRHMEELMDLHISGEYESHIVLVIHHGDSRIFVPNFHTDPEFARAMEKASGIMNIHAVSVETDTEGRVKVVNPELPVVYSGLEALRRDQGFYMILYNISNSRSERNNNPGKIKSGWYLLMEEKAERLQQSMKSRIQRKNRDGSFPEMLNYYASERKGIPVYCHKNLISEAAGEFENIWRKTGQPSGENSGIYYFRNNPLMNPDFTHFLFYFRHKSAVS